MTMAGGNSESEAHPGSDGKVDHVDRLIGKEVKR
jgi:hypothetical protein